MTTLSFFLLTLTINISVYMYMTFWRGQQNVIIIASTTFIQALALVAKFVPYKTSFEVSSFFYFDTSEQLYKEWFTYGIDGLSLCFILLTVFVFTCCLINLQDNVEQRNDLFVIHLLALEWLLIMAFSSLDVFWFYVFFEATLIPMAFLVYKWGTRERKIKAAYYLFLYTFVSSLFALFAIFYLFWMIGTVNYVTLFHVVLHPSSQAILWLCIFITFAVKIPMFPFHIWLPEAHVEAPTLGSIILASLLLKLGGYGFIRFNLLLLADAAPLYTTLVYSLAALSIVYASLITIRQVDLKRIIAYSSVAHMNTCVAGIFSIVTQGLDGAIYLMIAHGAVSSALFFCVGVLYDRHHTRLLYYYSGVLVVMPVFASSFFFFTLANVAFPGTAGFIAETLIFVGLMQSNIIITIIAATGIIWAAIYSFWLYGRTILGTLQANYSKYGIDMQRIEFTVLSLFGLVTLLLGLSTSWTNLYNGCLWILLDTHSYGAREAINSAFRFCQSAYFRDIPSYLDNEAYASRMRYLKSGNVNIDNMTVQNSMAFEPKKREGVFCETFMWLGLYEPANVSNVLCTGGPGKLANYIWNNWILPAFSDRRNH